MPTIIINLGQESARKHIEEMVRLDPLLEIREWPDIGNPEDIDIAMVWQMPQFKDDCLYGRRGGSCFSGSVKAQRHTNS